MTIKNYISIQIKRSIEKFLVQEETNYSLINSKLGIFSHIVL